MTKFNLDKLIELYTKGLSSRQVSKEIGCSQHTVIRLLKQNGIERKAPSCHRIHTFNYHYFDSINSEEKAYFMGFLWADGFCDKSTGNVVISLQETDKYILEKFKECIDYTGLIKFVKRKTQSRQNTYRLQMFNKHLAETLTAHGMVKAKSLILKFPTTVPNNLLHHFIRGYFDGDGSAYFSGNEYSISFCGTVDVLNNIKKIINECCCIDKGSLSNRREKDSPVKQLHYSGSNLTTLVREYLYKDATIYLERKYNKLKSIPILRKRTIKHIG